MTIVLGNHVWIQVLGASRGIAFIVEHVFNMVECDHGLFQQKRRGSSAAPRYHIDELRENEPR